MSNPYHFHVGGSIGNGNSYIGNVNSNNTTIHSDGLLDGATYKILSAAADHCAMEPMNNPKYKEMQSLYLRPNSDAESQKWILTQAGFPGQNIWNLQNKSTGGYLYPSVRVEDPPASALVMNSVPGYNDFCWKITPVQGETEKTYRINTVLGLLKEHPITWVRDESHFESWPPTMQEYGSYGLIPITETAFRPAFSQWNGGDEQKWRFVPVNKVHAV